jgi:hypothetical protein
MRSKSPAWRTIRPYLLAAIGPLWASGGQLILSIQMVHILPKVDFGSFSFLLVLSQFSFSISNALVCAPLPVIFHRSDLPSQRANQILPFANVLLCAAGMIIFFIAAYVMTWNLGIAFLYSLYATVVLFRWFARSYAYVLGKPLIVVASDLLFGLLIFGGCMLFWVGLTPVLTAAFGLLAVAALLALTPFYGVSSVFTSAHVRGGHVSDYSYIWKKYTAWSLGGVITTELTNNAHVYIVTAYAGPAAFAPIAAASLFIRPVSLASNALTDFERPRVAAFLSGSRVPDALGAIRTFKLTLLFIWMTCSVLSFLALRFSGEWLFPKSYTGTALGMAVALWLLIAGIRTMRMGEGVLLQAAGEFRLLAYATFVSSVLTVLAVGLLVAAWGPTWSLLGVAIGDLVVAFFIWKAFQTWKSQAVTTDPTLSGQKVS